MKSKQIFRFILGAIGYGLLAALDYKIFLGAFLIMTTELFTEN